jgi:hypothetical protein
MLNSHDVVRHRLVSDIVDAYGRWDAIGSRRRPRGAAVPAWPGDRRFGLPDEPLMTIDVNDESGEDVDAWFALARLASD